MVRIQIEYRSTGAVCPSLGGGEGAPWGAHRTCPTCAKIAQRALWARCPLDKRLHLLSARAVLQLADWVARWRAAAFCLPPRT